MDVNGWLLKKYLIQISRIISKFKRSLLFFAALSLVLVPSLLFLLVFRFSTSGSELGIANSIRIAEAVLSILLTSLLVYIYYKMGETQDRQRQIMENQERIMEIEHQPEAKIQDADLNFQKEDDRPANGEIPLRPTTRDEIEFTIENIGNGPLVRCGLRCDLIPVDGTDVPYKLVADAYHEETIRLEDKGLVILQGYAGLQRTGQEELEGFGKPFLDEGESGTYRGTLTFDIYGDYRMVNVYPKRVRLCTVLRLLHESGYEEVGIQFTLFFEDYLNNIYTRPLSHKVISTAEYDSIAEELKDSLRISPLNVDLDTSLRKRRERVDGWRSVLSKLLKWRTRFQR